MHSNFTYFLRLILVTIVWMKKHEKNNFIVFMYVLNVSWFGKAASDKYTILTNGEYIEVTFTQIEGRHEMLGSLLIYYQIYTYT